MSSEVGLSRPSTPVPRMLRAASSIAKASSTARGCRRSSGGRDESGVPSPPPSSLLLLKDTRGSLAFPVSEGMRRCGKALLRPKGESSATSRGKGLLSAYGPPRTPPAGNPAPRLSGRAGHLGGRCRRRRSPGSGRPSRTPGQRRLPAPAPAAQPLRADRIPGLRGHPLDQRHPAARAHRSDSRIRPRRPPADPWPADLRCRTDRRPPHARGAQGLQGRDRRHRHDRRDALLRRSLLPCPCAR